MRCDKLYRILVSLYLTYAAPQSEYTSSDCCNSSAPAGSAKRPSSRLAAAGEEFVLFFKDTRSDCYNVNIIIDNVMQNYDFQILQPNEFEHLVRDLLQKKESIFVESFTLGRDGGIDLRYGISRKSKSVVQVKRLNSYKSLKAELKKELAKIKNLNPLRYILATSVGLTPANKDEIITMCYPFIKSSGDILGRDDLNNLLGQYPEVERQYYKLWLASTTVLEDILNKRINTWSDIELDEIRREVSTYVMNDSFNAALNILKKNRYVIISGIPGIGKTTLSRMLVYYLLSQGYDEFVSVHSIDDVVQKLFSNKKQVFFYDDFLGTSCLSNIEHRFDKKLISFIDKIKRSEDKIFILSTREYILADAMLKYEIFSLKQIDLSKCILDLSHYSESIRAEILYNHLSMARLPIEYVKAIVDDRKYIHIIKHKNFNPRIIEAYLNKRSYQELTPKDYVKAFLSAFDNPFAVWERTFATLSKLTQCALLIRATMGEGVIFMRDWTKAVNCFIDSNQTVSSLAWDEQSWLESLKVIEGTFILSRPYKGDYLVDFHNPSVFDFLVSWLNGFPELQGQMIKGSYFCDQLYGVFSSKEYLSKFGYHRIRLRQEHSAIMINAFKRHFATLNTCGLKESAYGYSNKVIKDYYVDKINALEFFLRMQQLFRTIFDKNTSLYLLISQEMLEAPSYSLLDRMTVIDVLPFEVQDQYDIERIASVVVEQAEFLDDYINIMSLLQKTQIGIQKLRDEEFLKKINDAIDDELYNASSVEDCERISDAVDLLDRSFPNYGFGSWKEMIDEAQAKYIEEPIDDDFPDDVITRREVDNYEEMFTSLLCEY